MGGDFSKGMTDSLNKNAVTSISEKEIQPNVIGSPSSLISYNLQIALIIVCILLIFTSIYLYNKKC